MAMLPEMMQLGQLREMRQGLDQNDYQLRQSGREEQAAFTEADEFGQFEEFAKSTAQMNAPEQAQAFEGYLKSNPSMATNKRVTGTIGALGGASRGRIQAMQDQALEMDLNEQEGLRDINKERNTIAAKLGLDQAKAAQDGFQATVDSGQFETAEGFGNYLGTSGDAIGMKSKKQAALMADRLNQNPANKGLVVGLGRVIAGFGKADGLIKSYSAEMEGHKKTMDLLGSEEFGVDLDPAQDPEAFKASFDKAIQIANGQKNPASKKAIIEAATAASQFNGIASQSLLLKGQFEKELESVDQNDPQAMRDFITGWSVLSGSLNGTVDKDTQARASRFALEDQKLDMQKKLLGIQEMLRAPEKEKFDQEMAREAMALKRQFAATDETDLRYKITAMMMDDSRWPQKSAEERSSDVDEWVKIINKADGFRGTNGVSLLKKP